MRNRNLFATVSAALLSLISLTVVSGVTIEKQHELARVNRRAEARTLPTASEQRFNSLQSALSTGQAPNVDYLAFVCDEGMYQWPVEKFPIKVYIAPGASVPGYKDSYRSFIQQAFDTWRDATYNRLTWKQVNERSLADITIDWTNCVHERPEGTEAGKTATLTRLNTATNRGTIHGAKMSILTQLPDRLFAEEEVRKTCLHEVGHALGIQGHSPNRDDIMFYAVSPKQLPSLTPRDKATMTKLYSEYPSYSQVSSSGATPAFSTAN